MNRLLAFFSLLGFVALACSALPANAAPQNQSASSGSVLFQDDFSNFGTGWDRFMVAEGIMDYDSGGYRILVNATQTNFWATPRQNFADVRLEADAGKLGGPDENRVGLICRFTGNEYYFFLITSDGYYGVGVFAGGMAALLGQSAMQANSAIKTGLAVNHLRADCAGNTLTFYVNGFQVASVQDATLKSGDVGITAGTFDKAGVDIVFDNFVAFKP